MSGLSGVSDVSDVSDRSDRSDKSDKSDFQKYFANSEKSCNFASRLYPIIGPARGYAFVIGLATR